MKFIHAADLHIGSAFSYLKDDKKIKRSQELTDSFSRLVKYAKENDIKCILLSGDIFDKDDVLKSEKDYFYSIIKENSQISFYYLRGNHDLNNQYNRFDIKNLYMFSEEWKTYVIEDVAVSGIEINSTNYLSYYDNLLLDPNKFNIVMLHGQINNTITKTIDIDIKRLENKNINYLALGHVHKYQENNFDYRGIYVYPGCLEGRGFDEIGQKGFVVYDTKTKQKDFVSFSKRLIIEKVIDISNSNNEYEAVVLIKKEIEDVSNDSLLRIVITGKVNYDIFPLKERVFNELENKFFYLEVLNKAIQSFDLSNYENDISLRGEFVRNVLKNENLSEEKKSEIISLGLKLLNDEDIQI